MNDLRYSWRLLLRSPGFAAVAVVSIALEIGATVGAARSDVVRMVLRETFTLVATGFLIGVPVALAGARLISNRLFGVTSADPVTFALAACILTGVAVIAALVPAYRAVKVDPVVALRYS